MLQTTCPPTCPLVQVLVHFVGPIIGRLSTVKIAANVRGDMGLTDTGRALLLDLSELEVFELDRQHTEGTC